MDDDDCEEPLSVGSGTHSHEESSMAEAEAFAALCESLKKLGAVYVKSDKFKARFK